MGDRVLLVGLDFGSTTSSAVVASAEVTCNCATGRRELSRIEQEYVSDAVFTPLIDERLDEVKLAGYLNRWLERVDPTRLFGGGAVVTGLAAERANAAALAQIVRRRLKDAVIAVGGDPYLESWLAFMGNCADLSRAHAERTFLNLDIGGGTTNVALGRQGKVLGAGSYFVGARHIQVAAGGYRIERLSSYARHLLEYLKIGKQVGDELRGPEVLAIVDWQLELLESIVRGDVDVRANPIVALHEQARIELPQPVANLAVTLSGGVGQLVYAALQGSDWPPTTAFGDLGVDLARRIVERPIWRNHLQAFQPTALGRATAYGLLRYNTQVSGSTIFLSDPKILPLPDLIILGSVAASSSPVEVERLVKLAARAPAGASLRVEFDRADADEVRRMAARIRQALVARPPTSQVPLVLLMRENLGKVLGQCVSEWGASPMPLIVVDELDRMDGQFAHLGPLGDGVVPVSIYGMNAGDNLP
jgi:ethanolamine utilization protein EutA